jgi:hypothetical protein
MGIVHAFFLSASGLSSSTSICLRRAGRLWITFCEQYMAIEC